MDTKTPYRISSRARGQRAQELVEFALVLPVLLLVLFGIIELGRIVMAYNTLANAAREGARYGVVFPASEGPNSCAGAALRTITAEACQRTSGLDQERVLITSTRSGTTVSVLASYRLRVIPATIGAALRLDSSNEIPLSARSTMQVE